MISKAVGGHGSAKMETFSYNNAIVAKFAWATIIWGVVGMLVGVLVASQIPFPDMNLGQYLTFGRLRPLHTNAVIFAFVGNGMFTGIYYSVPRLCKARMYSDLLGNIHFWGWQAIIVSAALTLPMGISANKEYAELEWPIDIAITLIWVVFGYNMIMTLFKRREQHMYVSIWFYVASFIAVAMLHVFNSLEYPVHLFKSYSIYAGVHDALVQWWYGHNAVAFFLTTPYLGLMYYFMPKIAERPVYSYRLSIIHFWALIFIYIWAGPHHLLYSSVPGWAQSLGVVFSIMLIAPSWGGMLNGLLTLRGAWHKVKEDPILKFMVVAVTAYGMSTFEGPMMSLKNINGLAHFTDYVIGHVHVGGLGWNGMLTFGMLYWLFPRLYNTKLYSKDLASLHFWIATIGMVLYVLSMYTSGIAQGLMWKQFDTDGFMMYPNFLDTVIHVMPMHYIRLTGGLMYWSGAILCIYNLFKTATAGKLVCEEEAKAPAMVHPDGQELKGHWHQWLEGRPAPFIILSALALAVGGAVEILPTMLADSYKPKQILVTPYTPLELEGRDLYIREGCYVCHSQMIRPFKSETVRYGHYSEPGESVYEHPFLFGSKRTGPDLLRVGGKYPDAWHYRHMEDPRSTSPGSIMPRFPWLISQTLDTRYTQRKMEVMQKLKVPYTREEIDKAYDSMKVQQAKIVESLKTSGIEVSQDKEIVALIAYLQKLGRMELKRKDLVQGN